MTAKVSPPDAAAGKGDMPNLSEKQKSLQATSWRCELFLPAPGEIQATSWRLSFWPDGRTAELLNGRSAAEGPYGRLTIRRYGRPHFFPNLYE